MIFDSAKAEAVYLAAASDYPERANEFHALCKPLVESIAASVSGARYDDLVQDGHLKVQLVLNSRSYNPSKGRMYSFLSRILRNHMLDVLRAEHQVPYTVELMDEANYIPIDDVVMPKDYDVVVGYVVQRFPSIQISVMQEVSEYVVDAATEMCAGKGKGIVRTLCNTYMLRRHVANVVYGATMAVCRMDAMGCDWKCNIPDALRLATTKQLEISLLPEMVLCVGYDSMTNLRHVFNGFYVKY